MNKSGSGCVSSISVIYFLFQIPSQMDFLCCPGDHSSPWQPCTPPAVIAWVIIIRRKCIMMYSILHMLSVCVKRKERKVRERVHAYLRLSTVCICSISVHPLHFIPRDSLHSIALYITLAYFTAVLNRGQSSNEKELSWLKMPQLLLLAGLHWAFTKIGNLSTITAL